MTDYSCRRDNNHSIPLKRNGFQTKTTMFDNGDDPSQLKFKVKMCIQISLYRRNRDVRTVCAHMHPPPLRPLSLSLSDLFN